MERPTSLPLTSSFSSSQDLPGHGLAVSHCKQRIGLELRVCLKAPKPAAGASGGLLAIGSQAAVAQPRPMGRSIALEL